MDTMSGSATTLSWSSPREDGDGSRGHHYPGDVGVPVEQVRSGRSARDVDLVVEATNEPIVAEVERLRNSCCGRLYVRAKSLATGCNCSPFSFQGVNLLDLEIRAACR